jgi:uncharacterized protein
MRLRYFVDSWFFIAHVDKSDPHHRNARRLDAVLPSRVLLTHESVLTEVLAFFAEDEEYFRQAAADAVRAALRTMEVLSVDRILFLRALELYERRRDKHYSLTDCLSMVVMRDRNITHVLTNDHHFSQEGFTVLSDAP